MDSGFLAAAGAQEGQPDRVAARFPISIVCVFNDLEVRRGCLDRSIAELQRDDPELDYVPVDNVSGRFPSAGAALNHGAALATRDYIAFVHQDVYLHSLRALEEAAGIAAGGEFGMVGAVGVRSDGRLVGRIRDRVVLLGAPAPEPVEVDSVDEVLFVIPRRLVRAEPISNAAELAWHAYAVEYGMRVRSLGLRVGVADIPLTHNSLSANVDRLDEAHRAVAARYPDQLPLRTTCGTITTRKNRSVPGLLRGLGRRYWWLRESVAVRELRRTVGGGRFVLGDIRVDVDDVLARIPPAPMVVFSLDDQPELGEFGGAPRELDRRGRSVRVTSGGPAALAAAVRGLAPGQSALLTNLTPEALHSVAALLPPAERLVGWYRPIGCWVLLGPAAAARPPRWRSTRSRPLRLPALRPRAATRAAPVAQAPGTPANPGS